MELGIILILARAFEDGLTRPCAIWMYEIIRRHIRAQIYVILAWDELNATPQVEKIIESYMSPNEVGKVERFQVSFVNREESCTQLKLSYFLEVCKFPTSYIMGQPRCDDAQLETRTHSISRHPSTKVQYMVKDALTSPAHSVCQMLTLSLAHILRMHRWTLQT